MITLMNNATQVRIATLGFAAMFLLGATPLHAQSADGKKGRAEQKLVITESGDGGNETIEIRVEGGKFNVLRNGTEIPHAQIIQDDGSIVITDKDGKRIKKLNVVTKGKDGRGAFGFVTGDSPLLRSYGWGDTANPPKVMLGVHMSEPGPALEKQLRLEPGAATLIAGLYEGLPAHEAGLAEFDIIIKVDGRAPANQEVIRNTLGDKDAGESLTLTIVREGKPSEVKIKLAEYDADVMAKAKLIGRGPDQTTWTGLFAPGGTHDAVFHDAFGAARTFVAPKDRIEVEKLLPRIEQFHAWREKAAPRVGEDLESRLQRLDERLEQLERLLERLDERRERTR